MTLKKETVTEKAVKMEWSNFYQQMVERNIGVISRQEQNRLRKACVAVTGCGGIGGLSAEQLVRLGIGHVKIADFDNFETHNLSRQCGSTSMNIGQHKAKVLSRHFKDINPELKLDVFDNGITPENAEEFVGNAEIIIDGMDYSDFNSLLALYRAARKSNLCVINANAIGFGVNVFVFGPQTMSIEEYVGKSSMAPVEKMLPYVPSYADPEVVEKAVLGQINIPNIIMPQHLGTAIGVSEAIMILLGRVKAPAGPNPRIFIMDMQDRKFEISG